MPITTAADRVLAYLEAERDGCHGESERRAVAEFALDALSGNDDEFADDPAGFVANVLTQLASVSACAAVDVVRLGKSAEGVS